jgi:hypothetical protein
MILFCLFQGTSYTITNLERVTGYTSGTNYATDIIPNVPVRPEYPHGPFLHDPEQSNNVPEYVVSKTHCEGYCMDCGPADYYNMTLDRFEKGCRTCHVHGRGGGGDSDGASSSRKSFVTYDTPVDRAIHLIRSPYDNLVGRMHLAIKNRMRRGETTGFNHSKEGYDEWCSYLDARHANKEAYWTRNDRDSSSDLLSPPPLDPALPCRAEWYRYVQWHNLAWEVTSRRFNSTDVFYLYYDDYSSRYEETLSSLLKFVRLERAKNVEPLPFDSYKTYNDYFSPTVREQAKRYVEFHSHPEAWKLLSRYFD